MEHRRNAVDAKGLRHRLVEVALEWERAFGVAPAITSTLSELDAALLIACPVGDFCEGRRLRSAVAKGHDFIFSGLRYQVKANRPSGKAGSVVTLVAKASNYDWDRLIWVLYTQTYVVSEAWKWERADYISRFDIMKRLSPSHMRLGEKLYPK
jgi:hypothetical protein